MFNLTNKQMLFLDKEAEKMISHLDNNLEGFETVELVSVQWDKYNGAELIYAAIATNLNAEDSNNLRTYSIQIPKED